MYIDRGNMVEYPFDGEFFVKEVDTSLPPSEWEANERVVLSTKCDIQESAMRIFSRPSCSRLIFL